MDIVEQILERKRAHARETTQPAVAASNRANVLILEGRLGDALSVMADMPRHAQAAPTTHYVETLEQALTVATELGDDVRGAALAKAALDLEALDNLVWGRAAPGLRAAAVATLYRAGRINADRAHEILDIDRQPSTVGRWASTFAQALDIPGVLERARVTLPGDRLDRFEYFGHGASGRLLLRLGLIEDAIAELERTTRGVDAVAYPASYGRALADLSEAYEAQGDSSSAIATAEKLIALWGADPSRSADAARARVTRLR
jgi:tetratricopeptide (TPR) repeat protein